ncbi:MAG: hypothetical protein KDD70_17800 [Bdellovibrionales bacterium]|nr:hypothetical protein [Bdellovibrionales bacterium]
MGKTFNSAGVFGAGVLGAGAKDGRISSLTISLGSGGTIPGISSIRERYRNGYFMQFFLFEGELSVAVKVR